jgi:subtilisin family serine protease
MYMRKWKGAVAAIALAGSSAVAVGATLNTRGSASTKTGVQEWVVQYTSPAAAAKAHASIAAAGGRLTDEITTIGVARVMAGAGFAKAIAGDAGIRGVTRNRSLGNVTKGMPEVIASGRPANAPTYRTGALTTTKSLNSRRYSRSVVPDPLAADQWDMKMLDTARAHSRQTGRGVTVGVIDTGIDASQPDLAINFSAALSQNFTVDRPDIDGPCADEPDQSCNDAANIDEGGHGTHVAGTIGAAKNGLGIVGVAPDVTLVNLRAGQDSGYFFLFETLAAIDAARTKHIDVVNMSFYTDPWLYNCAAPSDVLETIKLDADGNPVLDADGNPVPVDPAQLAQDIAEQQIIRTILLDAIAKAQAAGVTMVAAAGNEATDLAAETRTDFSSPDYGALAYARVVKKSCLDLPAEAPGVVEVSAVGPSKAKSDYSNYGTKEIDVAAPGGFFRDYFGTDKYRQPQNMILSTYPLATGQEEGGFDADGNSIDPFFVRNCNPAGVCGYYQYLQGTSMASPHAAGVAALIVGTLRSQGRTIYPAKVARILRDSAREQHCPNPRTVDYTVIGRPAEWNATCVGSGDYNNFYGSGIVNAGKAVRR